MERILVSRQPIFGGDMTEFGYELLFRNSNENDTALSDGKEATTKVIADTFMEIGLNEMVGKKLAFINFDRDLLMGKYCEGLPHERVVLEVLETVKPDPAIFSRLQQLRSKGYRVALDDFVFEKSAEILRLSNFVKIDVLANDWDTLEKTVSTIFNRYPPARLIAEKVETREQFQRCKALGFDYFQGYFFCRPQLVEGRRLPVNRLAAIRLMATLNNPDADIKELEQVISQDALLTYKLLRYINSAIYSLERTVSSIRHAITLLGQEKIRIFANLLLISSFDDKSRDLIITGATRARMCEQLAGVLGLESPNKSFLAGLLSVLDAILDRPMEQILTSLPLEVEIVDALIAQKGGIGDILHGVLEYEKRNWSQARAVLNVDELTIREAYHNAVGWSLNTLNNFAAA